MVGVYLMFLFWKMGVIVTMETSLPPHKKSNNMKGKGCKMLSWICLLQWWNTEKWLRFSIYWFDNFIWCYWFIWGGRRMMVYIIIIRFSILYWNLSTLTSYYIIISTFLNLSVHFYSFIQKLQPTTDNYCSLWLVKIPAYMEIWRKGGGGVSNSPMS